MAAIDENITVEEQQETNSSCHIKNNIRKEINCPNSTKEENLPSDPDPLAYVNKNGFTSEIFKIEVRGLPKFYGIREFKKLLNKKLNLECNKLKTPNNRGGWLYACFRSEMERDKAIEVLSGYKWKGSVLSTKKAEPAPDPLVKRLLEGPNEESPAKKQKIGTKEEQTVAVLNSTAPLWNVPYDEQIKKKTEDAKEFLKHLGLELAKNNPSLKKWIEDKQKLNDGLICKLLDTRYLKDKYNDYRNKCEFSIGKDEVTGERRVGFRLGSYASGSVSVAPVDALPIIPKVIKDAVKEFEKFIQNSDIEVFDPQDVSGHWRQLTIRYSSATGQMMLIVGFSTQGMSGEEVNAAMTKVKDYYLSEESLKNSATSLYFQVMNRREKGSQGHEYHLLLGNKYIEEELCGLKFKISPQSFFQINTPCAEVLMESVRELSNLNEKNVLLDVCCGTGTIGLCLAKDCARVLGIEVVKQAVEAAKENAGNNQIQNCEFFCGKADEIFTSVVSRIPQDQEAVAILDPPRAGLHYKAILMLRKTRNLNKLLFMSCDSKAAIRNFIDLARPQSKTLAGNPFVPISAVIVDMFPHTPHYELILFFERIDTSIYLNDGIHV